MGDLAVRNSSPNPAPVPAQPEQTVNPKPVPQTTPAESHPAKSKPNPQHAGHKKSEQNVTGTMKQTELNRKLAAENESLPKQARGFLLGPGRTQFDFGRPLTAEQAARTIFRDGKMPPEAKLIQGPGANSWTVKTSDMESQQSTVNKMRARTETVDPGKPNEFTIEWAEPAAPVSAPKRLDLNNNFGFKITKTYYLDEGQSPVKYVQAGLGTGKGKGYEVDFEKPMTRQQVMDKLFDKSRMGEGMVKLTPVPYEPATMWQVEVIGTDAALAFRQPEGKAFQYANTEAKPSIRPSIPAGIRAHIENKSVPKDAVKHPPNVYVWEQEGHLVRVEKGSNGYYSYEATKLHPTDEKGNNTMRYFMKDKGMKAGDAWKEYIKHWDDIHRQIVTGFALALATGRMPGKAPESVVALRPRRLAARNVEPHEPVPAGAGAGKPAVDTQAPTVNTKASTINTKAPTVNTESPAVNTKATTVNTNGPTVNAKGSTVDPHASTPRAGSRPVHTNGSTIDATPAPGSGQAAKTPNNPWKPVQKMPENRQITIQTANGPAQMTVGEYRQKVKLALKWVSEQMQKNLARGTKNHDLQKMHAEAAQRFGLNKNWRAMTNPYL